MAISELETKSTEEQLEIIANILGSAASLLGEQTVAGKAAAVANATISTFLSAQKAYEAGLQVGGPAGLVVAPIAAGIAAAAGLKSIKSIVAVKTPKLGNGGASIGSVGSIGSAPSAVPSPSFNVLGDTGTNQLNESINSRNENPSRAYVVYNDVKTAEELDKSAVVATRI